MHHDGIACFVDQSDDLGHIPQRLECFLFSLHLLFYLLLLPHPQLPARFVQNFIQSSLFLRLDLLLQILLPLPLLLLPSNDLVGLI